MWLHDILSLSAGTLKVLDLTAPLFDNPILLPGGFGGLCEELEAMAGHNMLEALSLEVEVDGEEMDDVIGYTFQSVEKALVKSGWSALRQVSFKVSIEECVGSWQYGLYEDLQSLPDEYLSHLPKLESVAFNFSAYITKEHRKAVNP
jgi:hypothetical protein